MKTTTTQPATTNQPTNSSTIAKSTVANVTKSALPVVNKIRTDQLAVKDWAMPAEEYAASKLAYAIMGFRRQYGSKGIVNFASTWLEPTLKTIVRRLREQGFTVAEQVVGSTWGDRNYCFDVSRDGQLSEVLYVAHYDTVDKDTARSYRYSKNTATVNDTYDSGKLVKHLTIIDGVAMLTANHVQNFGVGCLGADDGAGLGVMLDLMASGTLGGYCFTTGEECGGYGAEDVVKSATPFLKQYKMAIEIDRRGFKDVIISQSAGDCASEEFGEFMAKVIGMEMETSVLGSYTDVSTFAEIIPECVNLSAGYTGAHSTDEQVCLPWLDYLAKQLKSANWGEAPIKRTAGDYGYKSIPYNYNQWGGYGYGAPYKDTTNKSANATSTNAEFDDYGYEELDTKTCKKVAMLMVIVPELAEWIMYESITTMSELDNVCFEVTGYGFNDLCKANDI